MRKVKVAFLIALPLVLLAGCSALFDFNVFSSLDKPAAPTLKDIETGGLAALEEDLSSPAVVDALAADTTARDQIKEYLETEYGVAGTGGTLDSPDKQDAAVLYGDLCLKTTSGDDLVNNAVAALSDKPADLSALLKAVVPPDVAADPAKFADMINGFLDAGKAYENLGESLGSQGVKTDMNLGDVAQKAAIAYLIQTAYATASTYDAADPVGALYDLVSGGPSAIPTSESFTDPFSSTPGWLQTILDASGATLPSI